MTLEALTALNGIPIVQSDSTVIDPPLKFIVISEVGTLSFKNEKDVTIDFVVPAVAAGGALPFILPGRIRKVLAATTIADANLLGLR